MEVNLSGEVRKLLISMINNFENQKNQNEIFDESIKEAKRNMRDTFSRINHGSEYKKWLESNNVVIVL
jgi:hypothetical protein